MTNTRTTDVEATVNQIKALERVGADIVRVSVPTMDAAEAFKLIKQQVNVPLVADIHFDYRIALKVRNTASIVCVLTLAISVMKSVFAWWLTVRAIKHSDPYWR
ncbi:4-hydroxy-3-methylbut-2-en-1-yl diphosphate synthase [Escherichia coli]|nr:4-hydroxy-3-methylbut-2-en-1-yl diphosphate synthase [Escherichia coli]